MTKFYAYNQEGFGCEAFPIKEYDETILVIAAPDEETAREAFNRVVEDQIRAIGKEPSESDFDFIVDDFDDEMYEERFYTVYNFDDV